MISLLLIFVGLIAVTDVGGQGKKKKKKSSMLRRQVFFAVASHRIQRLTWTVSATDILTEPVDFHFYNKIVLYCFSLALNKKSFSTTTIM